jgi:inositol phosphorylceramide mannosyltransferase catalytic subunit
MSVSVLSKLVSRYPGLCAKFSGEFLVPISSRPQQSITTTSKIPPIVYQTWEAKQLGKTHAKEVERFYNLNPEFSFVIFDREERDEYMKSAWGQHSIYEIYQKSLFGPMKVDIFRYCILFEKGGFYFDINKGITDPIKSFVNPESEALISYEHDIVHLTIAPSVFPLLQHPHNVILNWGMGFVADHPFTKKVIENICLNYFSFQDQIFKKPSQGIVKFTGPVMLTQSIHQVLLEQPLLKFDQAGINFDRKGITNMKRSWVRYMVSPAYTSLKSCKILSK